MTSPRRRAVGPTVNGRADGRLAPRSRAVVASLVLILALVSSMVAGCSDDDIPAGAAALTVTGTVEVTPLGEDVRELTNGATVDEGTRVTVVDGVAALEFDGGHRVELRPGSPASTVDVAAVPVLVAGDVLLSDGFPQVVAVGGWLVDATGPTQVRLGSAAVPASVTSYAGVATLRHEDGRSIDVEPLHTVVLATGEQFPLRYTPTDAWDRRYLATSAAFGDRLDALARGYTADLQPNTRRSVEFYEQVLPGLASESDFTPEIIDTQREAGEVVVGASLALAGVDGTFRERWARVFAFRDEGASWGLIAHREGVATSPVLTTIELAVGASPLSVDPRQPTPTTAPTTSPTTSPGTTGAEPTPTITVPPLAPPTTAPPVTPGDGGLLNQVLSPVGAVLDDLLSLLGLG